MRGDHVGDIKDLSQFSDGHFDEIYGSHVLEHIPQAEMVATLQGLNRILQSDGKLMISVPDLEVLSKLFVHPEVDKAGRFQVMRIMYGGQIDAHDFHYIGLNFEFLVDFLGQAGFTWVNGDPNSGSSTIRARCAFAAY